MTRWQPAGGATTGAQELTALWRIPGLAGGELEVQGHRACAATRRNLGGAAVAGAAHGLRSAFFKAPVPAGWTLTVVLSNATTSKRIAQNLLLLLLRKYPIQHTRFAPAAHSRGRWYVSCPDASGSPHHLHPCSATYKMALSTCRLFRLILPRCLGKQPAIFSYCSLVISITSFGPLSLPCLLVLARPSHPHILGEFSLRPTFSAACLGFFG